MYPRTSLCQSLPQAGLFGDRVSFPRSPRPLGAEGETLGPAALGTLSSCSSHGPLPPTGLTPVSNHEPRPKRADGRQRGRSSLSPSPQGLPWNATQKEKLYWAQCKQTAKQSDGPGCWGEGREHLRSAGRVQPLHSRERRNSRRSSRLLF